MTYAELPSAQGSTCRTPECAGSVPPQLGLTAGPWPVSQTFVCETVASYMKRSFCVRLVVPPVSARPVEPADADSGLPMGMVRCQTRNDRLKGRHSKRTESHSQTTATITVTKRQRTVLPEVTHPREDC